jgi:hypothetical protein
MACFKLKELHLAAISLQSLMAGELLVTLTFKVKSLIKFQSDVLPDGPSF